MNELIDILNQLKDSTKYPILSQAIILSPLLKYILKLSKVKIWSQFKRNCSITKCKLNTIEDHILEMYIKGYLIDYTLFINKKYFEFINYYQKTSR